MKFGQKLEQESVPDWSIHNVDYNSLKYEIKIHTKRDQASAITIPGHSDAPLRKFEQGFYAELCRQHDRVDLFVASKAAEISMRLDHLSDAISRLADRCARGAVTLKRQRRLVRYQQDVLKCGDDIQALFRFTRAQVEAFRKILKKYKKWTGSCSLGDRFREHILADPKSFTRRDLTHLHARYDETRAALRSAVPDVHSEPSSPDSATLASPPSRPAPPPRIQYWNEYDHGSEGEEGADQGYALYVDPDADDGFPGWGYVTAPFAMAKSWLTSSEPPGQGREVDRETEPLLSGGQLLATTNYSTLEAGSRPGSSSTDCEEGLSSGEDDLPREGYQVHYALPSLEEQGLIRFRARVLLWATVSCLAAAAVFTAVAGILLFTGRRKKKVEVEAGASVGLVASTFAACAALGMDLVAGGSWWRRGAVWATAGGVLLLDVMLLVLVVEV
ncbi:uncharacterized protein DNG_09348 [Cephalotrichum gorgonifer]|uniref:SPX domain-containing protein n=1 Tax=Cephalotrichum gorgonifer TaxID=2041049 RepID=A0AAE8N5H8_9PEZI|nr:uncharacterized protein DNG_09348 [Cephalotrichum gorgonifer]